MKIQGGTIVAAQIDAQSYELMKQYNINETLKNDLENKTLELYGTINKENLKAVIRSYLMTTGGFTSNVTTDTTQDVHNIDTVVNATSIEDTESGKYRKVPSPAHNKVIRDKAFPINEFVATMAESNKNIGDVKGMEFSNYIYVENLDKPLDLINKSNKAAGRRTINERTLIKKFKKVMDIGKDIGYELIDLCNTPNGPAYKLSAVIDGGYYVDIPYCQIEDLLACTNKNMLRLYIFLKDYCEEDKFTVADRGFIARSIGLSDNSTKNLDIISTMTNGLARLGYIEIKRVNDKKVGKDGEFKYKTINSYRIRTLDEWEEIKAKASGIKTK